MEIKVNQVWLSIDTGWEYRVKEILHLEVLVVDQEGITRPLHKGWFCNNVLLSDS